MRQLGAPGNAAVVAGIATAATGAVLLPVSVPVVTSTLIDTTPALENPIVRNFVFGFIRQLILGGLKGDAVPPPKPPTPEMVVPPAISRPGATPPPTPPKQLIVSPPPRPPPPLPKVEAPAV